MNKNWNLPPGVSLHDIEGDETEWKECPTCEGNGHTGSECCGWPVGDIGLCPRCHEHATNEVCPDCNGKGEVEVDN